MLSRRAAQKSASSLNKFKHLAQLQEKKMKFITTTLGLLLTLSAVAKAPEKPSIDIAILLDTSGSMQGLIDQTRSRIWKLINKLDEVKHTGLPVDINVGLYQYGSSYVDAEENYIKQVVALSTDHDLLAKELFSLKAQGSVEYAGLALEKAVLDLEWGTAPAGLKTIFLAGNETLKQGSTDVASSLALAQSKNIFVNTIYANNTGSFRPTRTLPRGHHLPGPHNGPGPHIPLPGLDPVQQEWEKAALLGGGSFSVIHQNKKIVVIKTPMDKKILELDKKVNKTFVPFGKEGSSYYKRMIDLDSNIGNSSTDDMINRGRYKAGGHYNIKNWDLVEAAKETTFKLEDLKDDDLPDQLKGKSVEEIELYLLQKEQLRNKLKQQIKNLYVEREAFIKKEMDRLETENGVDPIDSAMFDSLAGKLKESGFELN